MAARFREMFAYGAASGIAFATDIGTLALLADHLHWHYMQAAVVSFLVGGLVLYILSVALIFRFRRISNRALELSCFIGLGVVGLVVNSAVMFVTVEFFHAHYLLAKVAAGGCTFLINYLLRRHLLFSPRVN